MDIFLSELLLEIGCVGLGLDERNMRGLDLFLLESFPVHFGKPDVLFDLGRTLRAETFGRVF